VSLLARQVVVREAKYRLDTELDRTAHLPRTGLLDRAHSWHTDSAGYADVYLRVSGSPAGQRVTARAGATSCVTTLP
jgi:hypothetical protein